MDTKYLLSAAANFRRCNFLTVLLLLNFPLLLIGPLFGLYFRVVYLVPGRLQGYLIHRCIRICYCVGVTIQLYYSVYGPSIFEYLRNC